MRFYLEVTPPPQRQKQAYGLKEHSCQETQEGVRTLSVDVSILCKTGNTLEMPRSIQKLETNYL